MPANFLKKRLLHRQHRCFPVNFSKFLRTPFLQNTSKRPLPIQTEAAARIFSVKKVFLEISQISQVFSCEFCKITKNTFFHRTPLVAASEYKHLEFIILMYLCQISYSTVVSVIIQTATFLERIQQNLSKFLYNLLKILILSGKIKWCPKLWQPLSWYKWCHWSFLWVFQNFSGFWGF